MESAQRRIVDRHSRGVESHEEVLRSLGQGSRLRTAARQILMPPFWKFYESGFPFCCEAHARHYWMVVWDVHPDRICSFKLSLS